MIKVNNTNPVIFAFLNQYVMHMYMYIAIIPINAASSAHSRAESHNVGLTLSSCINIRDAGIAPLFRLSTNSFADSLVNDPSICAVPPHILAWITGADN